jgi:hypothetical protein
MARAGARGLLPAGEVNMASIRVMALAGRRIDRAGAAERFPAGREALVRRRVRDLLALQGASVLVCSAACGADIVALEAARALGLRRRIVLPFSVTVFRETSVTDRGEVYGPRYDALVAESREAGDLVVSAGSPDDAGVYLRTNEVILDEAVALADQPGATGAVLVWEGQSRGSDDATAQFAEAAERRGLPVWTVSTRG